ncbi:MAG: phosphatase domain-containing protein [Bacteriovorax sp.]
MKRPHLVHFLSIVTDDSINIKASITMKENTIAQNLELDIPTPKFPIQALRLLNAYQFTMKIVGVTKNQKEIYKKSFESDSFGNFNFKIPLTKEREQIEMLHLFEVRKRPGLELHLGTYIPLRIFSPKKLIICDFDKTLVDTKYSTTKEVYRSLTRPIDDNPTVTSSVNILHRYIKLGHHPFILSASPHFYEDSMRDWLYKNNIFSAGIFLKDYRHFFSFLEGELTTKDLKSQGLYKLNHLLDILLMTGIPDELVLMGDNFESDPAIYLTLAKILREDIDPWVIWNSIKEQDIFQLKKKQNSQFLNKIYQLDNLLTRKRKEKNAKKTAIKIYIRKRFKGDELVPPELFEKQKKLLDLIEMYDGLYQEEFDQLKQAQEKSVNGADNAI